MPQASRTTAVLSRSAAYSPARTERPLTIGIAHPAFGAVGGAEVLLGRYVRYLRSLGHRIRFVTRAFDRATWPDLARDGDIRELPNSWKDHLGLPGTHPEVIRRCARHAAALDGVDVIMAGNHPSNVIAAFADAGARSLWCCMEPSRRLYPSATMPTLTARLLATTPATDTPLLSTVRPSIDWDMGGVGSDARTAQRALDRRRVPDIARITAISQFTAASVRRIYGRTVDEVIYPTVEEAERVSRARGVARGALHVLVHGRMDVLKNVDTVLRGFALFTRSAPASHQLHLVGTGPDLPRLRDLIQQLGIAHCTQVHGFLERAPLRALYEHCDVMAALPVDEPFGMVFPEAALRGLLLLGPDHGGPSEILDGGSIGWMVDAFDPGAVAAALGEIASLSIGEAERVRERAYRSCIQRFSPEVTLPAIHAHVAALAEASALAQR